MLRLFRKNKEKVSDPVFVKDEAGTFQLDRKYNWFEGQVRWMGTMEEVTLDKDEDGDTAYAALRTLHMLTADSENWDKRLREYAARELTELANEWQEEEEFSAIKEEEFAERIGCPTFHIDNRGDFEAGYDDDDMFYGHWIVVRGTTDGELTEANIEG